MANGTTGIEAFHELLHGSILRLYRHLFFEHLAQHLCTLCFVKSQLNRPQSTNKTILLYKQRDRESSSPVYSVPLTPNPKVNWHLIQFTPLAPFLSPVDTHTHHLLALLLYCGPKGVASEGRASPMQRFRAVSRLELLLRQQVSTSLMKATDNSYSSRKVIAASPALLCLVAGNVDPASWAWNLI